MTLLRSRCVKNIRSYSTKPTSHFSDFINNSSATSISNDLSKKVISKLPDSPSTQSPYTSSFNTTSGNTTLKLSHLRDLTVVLSIITLAYFAIDNYRTRLQLEQKINDLSLNHMKAIAVTQNNFNNYRKKREIQVLNERRGTQKREMKMVYHISMLRKQLIDAGLKPVEIDEAIAEFEKNVKMETSISNVSGTALWVVDDSPMKGYVPNIRDYESKK